MYSRVRHIFFDLDHTLWDFESNSREALADMYDSHGMESRCGVEFGSFLPVYESINARYWAQYSAGTVAKNELRYRRFHDAFLNFGFDDLALSKTWADEYLRLSPYKTHLMPGALEALQYLHGKYDLHLITNGFAEVQNIKIDQSRLRPYFQTILISEEHGVSKPAAAIFRLAEQLSGASTDECLMIGDNLSMDIEGAQGAGRKAVHLVPGFDGPSSESPGWQRIGHLSALQQLL